MFYIWNIILPCVVLYANVMHLQAKKREKHSSIFIAAFLVHFQPIATENYFLLK